MKELIILLVGVFLLAAVSATARKKEPVPVYIDKPSINRPRTMSIPDRNRLYAILNPRPKRMSPEVKEYLEKLEADKK
jgi:hypothetical protein